LHEAALRRAEEKNAAKDKALRQTEERHAAAIIAKDDALKQAEASNQTARREVAKQEELKRS
jgi:hypothetical protein